MQKKYIVDGNLKDDTGYHTTGDIVLMDEDQAAPLVEIGRLKPAVDVIPPPPAPATPDGFPDRNLGNKEPENPPLDGQNPPVPNAESNPPANDDQGEQVPPPAPASPTPEQIAKDMAQLG